ncbi:MAG: carboxyl transferase [Vallitaleaceae bacterium]|jgi:acetyl-CoA carboxylase carboxyltransferase component|nr:carboxyl transferase [Vallitaleaceae bacterium]
MTIEEKINDLANRRTLIEQGGGIAAINKIHASSQLTARERIIKLLDHNSFVEVGAFIKPRATDFNMNASDAPADGVITGYGAIEGQLVYVYSQDKMVMGGALGEMHAQKIVKMYEMAYKVGAPVIALLDSAGIRLQESLDALDGFGQIFMKQSLLSGVVPQLTAVLGNCGGGAAIIPSMSDFTFMTSTGSALYVNSANALDAKVEMADISSAQFHARTTGLIDFIYETDEEVMEAIRKLMVMLPLNNSEDALVVPCDDDPNRISPSLNVEAVSARAVLSEIADHNEYLEIQPQYATDVVASFIRMNGMTVGVVGNDDMDGILTLKGCEKMTDFVNVCDAYHIPVVTLTNVTGFEPTLSAEKLGMSKSIAKLTYAFANATTSKINVIINKAYGSAYIAQNSKHIGADLVYAWPSAQIATMNANSAVRIMYAKEIENAEVATEFIAEKIAEYENNQASPYVAAGRGYVDNIIEPAATRKRIIAAIEMLYTKHESGPEKKHGTV